MECKVRLNATTTHSFAVVLPPSLNAHQQSRAREEMRQFLSLLPRNLAKSVRGIVIDLFQSEKKALGHADRTGIIQLHLRSTDIDRSDYVLAIRRFMDALHHELGHVFGFERFGPEGFPPNWPEIIANDNNNMEGVGPNTPIEDFAQSIELYLGLDADLSTKALTRARYPGRFKELDRLLVPEALSEPR